MQHDGGLHHVSAVCPRRQMRPQQLLWSRGRLPAATMDCPRRDQAPLGAIAQLGERLDRTQEVGGSSPPSSIEGDAPATAGVLSFMDLSGSNWSQMAKLTCAATI